MATKHHSSYWIDDNSVFDFDSTDINKENDVSSGIDRVVKLATIRRAITNFVRILTNDSSIIVKYSSGKESYTDGKQVIISADDNPKNFDPMVGLALHEGSHCLLSDFPFLAHISTHQDVFYAALHPKLRKMVKLHKLDASASDYYEKEHQNQSALRTLFRHIKTLMNVIEDRRIDSYVYKMAPGYRPYYDAMYTKYFFNTDVEKNLKYNRDWRKPTVENYVNWLLMIFSPHFDKKALPGLGKMVKMIDLPNIHRFDEKKMPEWTTWRLSRDDSLINPILSLRHPSDALQAYDYEQFPLLWKMSNELMIEILKRAKFHADIEEDSESNAMDGLSIESDEDTDDIKNEGMPNYDLPQNRYNEKKANSAIEKMKDMMDQTAKKKKLKKNEQTQIDSIDSASADMTENSDPIYGKIPCLVTKKLTKEIMVADWFPFANSWAIRDRRTLNHDYNYSYRGFLNGLKMGQILAHKLQVRNEPQITHFTRQEHGKIDRRILSQLGMDIENVFKRTTVDSYNPVLLYLSVDASGSMGGRKWERVMTVMTALAYASDKIRNLEVVISLRGNLGTGIPMVAVVYDSRVDNFVKAKALFPYLCSNGSTPEGLCYPATMDLIKECAKTHTTYFINFSDGEPGCSFKHNGRHFDYGGEQAFKQTKNCVRVMREMGVRIMSYFISDYQHHEQSYIRKMFRTMYGQEAEFVDVASVVNVLKTLNKLLLVKE
jgi:hypothetical protein